MIATTMIIAMAAITATTNTATMTATTTTTTTTCASPKMVALQISAEELAEYLLKGEG